MHLFLALYLSTFYIKIKIEGKDMVENCVRIKRKQLNLSIEDLGALTKIPAAVISMIEIGCLMPDSDLQTKLAHALQTKKKKLFPESGTKIK